MVRPVLPVTRAALHSLPALVANEHAVGDDNTATTTPAADNTATTTGPATSASPTSLAAASAAATMVATTNTPASVDAQLAAAGHGSESRRWLQPTVAAAVLLLISVGVGVGGSSESTSPSAGAVVPAAAPPTLPATVPPTIPATTTTAPRYAGDGRPLLGEPTGLALYAAITRPGSNASTLERIDLDTGRITELDGALHGYPHQLMMAGDRLVVADDSVHGIDSAGADRTLLPNAGSVVINEGSKVGAVTMHDQQAVLRLTDANASANTPVTVTEIPLPPGVTKAFPDGLDQVVYEGPTGGVFRLDPTTGQPHPVGWGHLRWAGHGFFQDVSCNERAQCHLMLHNLADGSARQLVLGPSAASAIAFPDPFFHLWVIGSVLPGDASARTSIVRADDGALSTAPVTLGPARYCSLGDCIPAQPMWTADGRWMLTVGDGTVSAWRMGLDEPITLPIDGRVVAMTVALSTEGPGQPSTANR